MYRKISCLLIALLLVSATDMQAQESPISDRKTNKVFEYSLPTYEVNEVSETISTGTHNAFKMFIPDCDILDVEKEWKKTMKKRKSKPTGDLNEMVALQAKIKTISADKVDVYAKFAVKGDGVELTSLYNLEGEYLTADKYPAKAEAIEALLNEVALVFARKSIKEEIKVEKKELKAFEKEHKKLEKEGNKIQGKLDKYLKIVAEIEAEKSSNMADQKAKLSDIKNQKQAIENSNKKKRVLKK
ncbi:MAG: hypothetical protein ACPG5B_03690 [Chitinophagales bacterium]